MPKYKKVKDHHRFWSKIFNYIKENKISDPFGLIYYVTLTPSNLLNPSKSLKKELKKIQKLMRKNDIGPETVAIFAVSSTFDFWSNTGKFLKQTDRALEQLYNGIIKDYRKADPVSYEDITEKDYVEAENLTKSNISAIAWFFINSALENKNVEEVNSLLEKLKEDEPEETGVIPTTHKESAVIGQMLDNSLLRDSILMKEYKQLDLEEETMLKIVHGKKSDDKLILPFPLLKWIIVLIRLFLKFNQYNEELKEQINRVKEHANRLYSSFRDEMRIFFEEYNRLVEELHTLKARRELDEAKKERKEIAQTDKYELEVAELKARISTLQEEKEYLSNLVEDLKEQLKPGEEKLEPLPEKIKIAYFGLSNPALEQFLAKYNVFMETHSPINPKQDIPALPIVFNIDVANHKVYDHLKEHKPLLVSGSNAEILGKLIIEWIKDIKK